MTRLEDLTAIALELHEGQVDKQGCPYSEHILAVCEAVSDEAKPVALFHDAIEDGRATYEDLRHAGLSATEVDAVWWLTRYETEPYETYIVGIKTAGDVDGMLAREVKIADLCHNLSRLTPELESLRSRYEKALRTLGAESGTEGGE